MFSAIIAVNHYCRRLLARFLIRHVPIGIRRLRREWYVQVNFGRKFSCKRERIASCFLPSDWFRVRNARTDNPPSTGDGADGTTSFAVSFSGTNAVAVGSFGVRHSSHASRIATREKYPNVAAAIIATASNNFTLRAIIIFSSQS